MVCLFKALHSQAQADGLVALPKLQRRCYWHPGTEPHIRRPEDSQALGQDRHGQGGAGLRLPGPPFHPVRAEPRAPAAGPLRWQTSPAL